MVTKNTTPVLDVFSEVISNNYDNYSLYHCIVGNCEKTTGFIVVDNVTYSNKMTNSISSNTTCNNNVNVFYNTDEKKIKYL